MVTPYRPKPPRNRVAISTRDLARRMRKRLNKTTEGIEAAVAKVKNNAETALKKRVRSETDLMEEGSAGLFPGHIHGAADKVRSSAVR
jgi:hypothetical protein